jgi:hypothetical protein
MYRAKTFLLAGTLAAMMLASPPAAAELNGIPMRRACSGVRVAVATVAADAVAAAVQDQKPPTCSSAGSIGELASRAGPDVPSIRLRISRTATESIARS